MAIQNILVVDDSATDRFFLTELLQTAGFTVTGADNGEECLAKVSAQAPDVVLMDVVMPGQNGFQLTRSISRNPAFADVPIIMCTSKNQETDKVWGMRQGAKAYITKPFSESELSELIVQYLA